MAGALVEAELATGLGRSRDNRFEMQSQCVAARKSHADAARAGDGAEFARPCPACARTTNHRRRFRVNDCDILQCSSCGLGRTETAGFDPAAYYTSDYFSGRHADGYSDYLGAELVIVPASLIIFQLRRMLGLGRATMASISRCGIPLNLFDAMATRRCRRRYPAACSQSAAHRRELLDLLLA